MKLRYPVLTLVLMVLPFLLIAGCSGTGNSSSSQNSLPLGTPAGTVQTSSAAASITSGNIVTIELTAAKMSFDKSMITVLAGAPVIVNFHNREDPGSSQVTGISHNFAVYDSPDAKTTIFSGEIITGGEDATYRFTAPAVPGTYFFRCDVHPAIMNGAFIVQQ